MGDMKVAAIQMNSSDSVSDNLHLLDSLLSEASQQDNNLVLLPENFAFMGHPKQLVEEVMEDFNDGPIQSLFLIKPKSMDCGLLQDPFRSRTMTKVRVLLVV